MFQENVKRFLRVGSYSSSLFSFRLIWIPPEAGLCKPTKCMDCFLMIFRRTSEREHGGRHRRAWGSGTPWPWDCYQSFVVFSNICDSERWGQDPSSSECSPFWIQNPGFVKNRSCDTFGHPKQEISLFRKNCHLCAKFGHKRVALRQLCVSDCQCQIFRFTEKAPFRNKINLSPGAQFWTNEVPNPIEILDPHLKETNENTQHGCQVQVLCLQWVRKVHWACVDGILPGNRDASIYQRRSSLLLVMRSQDPGLTLLRISTLELSLGLSPCVIDMGAEPMCLYRQNINTIGHPLEMNKPYSVQCLESHGFLVVRDTEKSLLLQCNGLILRTFFFQENSKKSDGKTENQCLNARTQEKMHQQSAKDSLLHQLVLGTHAGQLRTHTHAGVAIQHCKIHCISKSWCFKSIWHVKRGWSRIVAKNLSGREGDFSPDKDSWEGVRSSPASTCLSGTSPVLLMCHQIVLPNDLSLRVSHRFV